MAEKPCKVFTTPEIVSYMLDKIGYVNHLYGKKILENSCGTGRFLCEIIKRYILDGRRTEKTDVEIKGGLERDITGIEKEPDIYKECWDNLDRTAMELGIQDVQWNILIGDALKSNVDPIYQFVVGNPPYVTYYNLSGPDREIIKKGYEVCKIGKPDYYYAFTEAAIKSLAEDGIMAYLIPNNFMKNRYSEELRKYILPYLLELEDFKFKKIFEGHQTSSAIVVCSKRNTQDNFIYTDMEKQKTCLVYKRTLSEKWTFDSPVVKVKGKKRFGVCFKVSAPVATLLNEAFLIQDFQESDKWVEKNGCRLEKNGLHPSASPKSKQSNTDTYIIFPYYYDQEGYHRYSEDEFTEKFPGIKSYLQQFKGKLLKRDVDEKCQWFEYGRSQALAHINQEKLLLSTLITGKVKYYRLDRETVPYSGMYIVPKENYTIEQAEQIIESDDFENYIKAIGIHASGKTYRISPHDVEEYVFEEKW